MNQAKRRSFIMKIIVDKMKKNMTDEEEKAADEFLNDGQQEDWETGKLGRDPQHMQVSDITLSGKPTSLRLPESLRNKLTSLARKKGLSTHSYIRMVLIEHIDKSEKKAS